MWFRQGGKINVWNKIEIKDVCGRQDEESREMKRDMKSLESKRGSKENEKRICVRTVCIQMFFSEIYAKE